MYNSFHGSVKDDALLREYFPDYAYKGVFLDIGAGHPITISNSYHFRMNGWEIYSVDANPRLAAMHRDAGYRIVECAAVSVNEGTVEFDAYTNDLGWGGNVSSSKGHAEGTNYEVIDVSARTLDDILANEFKEIDHIDILSMDIEVSEMDALEGFDISFWHPTVLFIEDHFPQTSGLEALLNSHGYRWELSLEVMRLFTR